MRLKLTAVFFFLCSVGYSQNWAPIGAHWIYSHWTFEDVTWDAIHRTGEYEVTEDTTIQGQLCSKLVKSDFEVFCDGRPDTEYMYSSNDTVYFYDTAFAEFQPLYCFGAAVNDFWYIKIKTGGSDIDSIKITVNTTGVTVINSFTLTQLNVTYLRINEGVEENDHNGVIIETLGDIKSMFNYSNPPAVEYWAPIELRCYEDIVIGDYEALGVNDDCYMSLTTIDSKELLIYPNPAADKLVLGNMQEEVSVIRIYSVDGKKNCRDLEFSEGTISVSELESGAYFIFLETNDGSIHYSRFIKD